jgi:spermidine/putrescine transport system ATP-binding protein
LEEGEKVAVSSSVEFQNIQMRFGDMVALHDVSLQISRGSFVVLLGPSGSGKTTLLNILGGFLEPTSGRVLIDGQDITHLAPAQRPTATVFQDYALFPHMSVEHNVAFGLRMRGIASEEKRQRVQKALDMVGLAGFGQRRIHQLSGGQRQRVALARSIVIEPAVLLLDEPLGALDLNLRRQMQDELTALQKRLGMTFVHVTHDQDEAMSMADVIVVMNQGRIEDVGSPDRIYLEPQSKFTATFMGESNLLEASVKTKQGGQLCLETTLGLLTVQGQAEVGDKLYLSIRPEQIVVATAPRTTTTTSLQLGEMQLKDKQFLGTHYRCSFVHPAGQIIKARLPQGADVLVGQVSSLSVATNNVVLLTR